MKDGINVTTVCPGLMRTGSPRNADFKGKHRFEYAWFSISDALPLLTVSAENAARQIVQAASVDRRNLSSRYLQRSQCCSTHSFPEAMSQMLAIVNQVCPQAGGVGTQRVKGKRQHVSMVTIMVDHTKR